MGGPVALRPGISVKLSALHPRFEFAKRARMGAELLPRVRELARQAAEQNLGLCIDAEEADRLESSLDMIESRSLARAVGRARAGRAGPPEAGAAAQRVAGGAGAGGRAAADGAPGLGRLLGYRDHARAAGRARRLPGVHAQGRDRYVASGARAGVAGGRRRARAAVRDPQRPYRGGDSGFRRRQGRRVPAPARHGRALVRAPAGGEGRGGPVPRVRAGRRPRGSVAVPGAAAAGKRRQHFVRQPHLR